ncbi:hypothetical protein [Streptomyces sp. KR80]|uniref:hypothetical protein n=1 Tax=Streptomyces sp. KR80 TaxID=3457426 RepID=UPI003FD6056C
MKGWCSWHEGYAEDPVLVGVVEVGSGPGGSLYACRDCVEAYRLKPLSDHPEESDGSPLYEQRRS